MVDFSGHPATGQVGPVYQLGQVFGDSGNPQDPADVSVIMPTVLRPAILRAIESIYGQDFEGRIQLVIGVDVAQGSVAPLMNLLSRRPERISALVLTLPWSTSIRHGGVHTALDCGALRSLLSFLANSVRVTYMDDDNTMMPDHIRLLYQALQGKAWSFTQRLLVDERTNEDLVVDRWDSVGPNRGRMASQGGFVDTNCLMIDKIICARALGRWSESGTGKPGLTADRNFFAAIRGAPYGCVERPTVRYFIRETSIFHRFIQSNAVF